MTLPYYRIEKTLEGKQFFLSHTGYFNFFDQYLIANTEESNGQIFFLLVNRTGKKFSNPVINQKQKDCILNSISDSVCLKKPEEMFIDFPELEKYNYLKIYSKYYEIK